MPPRFDVFLSYPRKDLEPVRALVSALKAEGLTVWLDESNIEAFERIHDHVAQGVADSRVVLAWYSLNYAASRPCQSELSAAYLCEAGERVLVVNPESDHGHIQPRALVNRLYSEAKDPPAIARRVKAYVSRFASSIGDAVSFTQPLHYGRQLAGSNRFVGRTPILWKTHDTLEKSGAALLTGTRRSVVQLRGFGGVGKSLLAEEYGLRFGAAYPGGIFWLKAYGNDDDQGINQTRDREGERRRQISEFASNFRIPIEGRPTAEIRTALGQVLAAGRRSLWIVDDLPSALNSEALEQWLSPHVSVPTLITTRDRSHSSLGESVDVDVLSNEESLALLEFHRRVEDVEQNAARDLLDALGHHALAVEIAASYLGNQQSISIDEFLNELRNPREDVLEEAAALADALPIDHSPSIVATLNTTISQLSEPARDLLCLASCLAPAPIPKELIEAVLKRLSTPDSPGLARKKAVKETERFALSRKESMPADAVSVHTLVARTARRRAGSQDRIARIHAAAVGSLIDTLYGVASLGSILRRSLEITHARAVSDSLATPDEASLLVLVANADLSRGDLESADRLARRALRYCTEKLGEDSLETCFAKSGIAMVMLTQRNYADAHQILATVAPVFERSLPAGDRYRIGAQLGLALTMAAQGELAAARNLADLALRASTDANGSDHPLTLGAKSTLGQILLAQGEVGDATTLQREVVDARTRIAETADVDTLTDEFLMAQSKVGSGEIEAVAPIIEKAATVFQQTLGGDNVLTLHAKLYLLILLGSRQDAQSARELAAALVPRFERLFGPANPATLQAYSVQAGALLLLGDGATAQTLSERVVAGLEAALGPEHVEVMAARVGFAQALCANGDPDAARRILDEVIPSTEARLGHAHQVTLNARLCLASCLQERNDRAGERTILEEVVAAREISLGKDHPDVLRAKLSLAQCLFALDEFERSSEVARQLIPLAEVRFGQTDPFTMMSKSCFAMAIGMIAENRFWAKDYPRAIELLQEMMPVAEAALGREHGITVNAKLRLALALNAQGRIADTCEYLTDVLAVLRQQLEPTHDIMTLEVSLAQALNAAGRHGPAKELMIKTLAAAEASLGPTHQTALNAKYSLALSLHALGQYREACKYLEDLLSANTTALGAEHPDTVQAARCLFISLWEAGDLQACRQIFFDHFQDLGQRDPHTLTQIDKDIRSKILSQTDWRLDQDQAKR